MAANSAFGIRIAGIKARFPRPRHACVAREQDPLRQIPIFLAAHTLDRPKNRFGGVTGEIDPETRDLVDGNHRRPPARTADRSAGCNCPAVASFCLAFDPSILPRRRANSCCVRPKGSISQSCRALGGGIAAKCRAVPDTDGSIRIAFERRTARPRRLTAIRGTRPERTRRRARSWGPVQPFQRRQSYDMKLFETPIK